jgi:POT family proton-dependent oligopeptide transporter
MHQPTWWGHPRGVFLVAFTELWERFSYWGLAGLLVLYLTAAPAAGGWGWENADAVQFYGWYGGLAFALPVVGGWLANNYLGERRCILWGGVAITTGHAMLAAPVVVADQGLAHSLFLFGLLLIVLGTGLLKPTISSIVAQLYPGGDARRDEGFSLFFVAIYIGAMLGALVTAPRASAWPSVSRATSPGSRRGWATSGAMRSNSGWRASR